MRREVSALLAGGILLLAAGRTDAAGVEKLAVQSPDGRRHVSAVEAPGGVKLDGVLDDEVWGRADAGRRLRPGRSARRASRPPKRTEVRDRLRRAMLVHRRLCHDSDPAGIVVNDIRKDFTVGEQDTFEVLLDTFADRRNGFVFATNAAGAKADTQIANEGRDVNANWDAVWWVPRRDRRTAGRRSSRFPFKTLRFEAGRRTIWGINFARRIRRKNEIDYWSPVPRAYSIYRASVAGRPGRAARR